MTRLVCFFLLMAAASAQTAPSQPSETEIPRPSGPFAVGRTIYDWVDPSRPETLSKATNARREIMVDVWYPAGPPRPGARTAPYFPGAAQIDKSPASQAEKDNWRGLWKLVVAGGVHTHAYENAPAAPGQARFPLIIMSHAFIGEPYAYTHQIQEMVSRGYVVAAIHHTYEVRLAAFPDGRMIPFSEENARGVEADTPEEMRKWAAPRIDVWAADIRFTLDQMARLDNPKHKAPFAGRVDLGRVGVFGHSFGGMAAARACELDQRIKACLNQDGGVDGPILRYDGGHPFTQPFMFLRSPLPGPPSDEMLKALGLTRKELEKDEAEAEAALEKELQDCSGGAYLVSIAIPAFGHNSFTDIPMLRLAGRPDDAARALSSLRVVESYTIAFFDKFLKGAQEPLLDKESVAGSEVQIKRYPK